MKQLYKIKNNQAKHENEPRRQRCWNRPTNAMIDSCKVSTHILVSCGSELGEWGGGRNAAKLFYGFPLRSDIESGWMFQSFRPASLQMHLSTIISWFSFPRNLCSVFHFDWFLFQYDPCYSFARWILVANKWSNPSWKGTAYLTFNCDWSIIIKERQREK